MKRLVFLFIVLTQLLCSCAAQPHTVIVEGETFLIDMANREISHNDQIYKFQISGDKTTITYPNDSTYWWTQQDNVGFGGWSDNYDENKYISGSTLIKALSGKVNPGGKPASNVVAAMIAIAIGIWNIVSPYSAWYLSYGWRYKNAEPSEAAIILSRVGGVIAVLFGIIFAFAS